MTHETQTLQADIKILILLVLLGLHGLRSIKKIVAQKEREEKFSWRSRQMRGNVLLKF